MINISPKFSFPIFSLTSILFAGTLTASAETVEISSLTWKGYRSNTETINISVSSEDDTVSFSNADKGSYVWAHLDSPISVAVGEVLTISGTLKYTSTVSSANYAAFYFGLYDSGDNKADSLPESLSSITEATYSMTGFFAGTRTSNVDSVVTYSSAIYSVYKAKEDTKTAGFMTTNQNSAYIASQDLLETVAVPVQNVDYDFSLSISRTEEGYSISYDDGEKVAFSNEKSLTAESFDVIGFKCIGSKFALSSLNYTISVIPEPSLFGLFAGTAALVLAGTRRRRK